MEPDLLSCGSMPGIYRGDGVFIGFGVVSPVLQKQMDIRIAPYVAVSFLFIYDCIGRSIRIVLGIQQFEDSLEMSLDT